MTSMLPTLKSLEWTGFPRRAAMLVAALGLVVLVGWALNVSALKSVLPDAVTMKANTALCFLLAGSALFLRMQTPIWQRPALGMALMVVAISIATLSEYMFGWQLGIDHLLFHEMDGALYTLHPGRMSLYAATGFFAIGFALFALHRPSLRLPLQLAATWALLAGILPLLGYLWDISALITTSTTPPAIHAALGLMLLGAVLLQAAAQTGRATLFESLERKVLLAFIGTLLLFIFSGGLTYRSSASFAESAKMVARTQEVRNMLNTVYGNISDAESAQRNYLLIGDKRQRALYIQMSEVVSAKLESLAQLVSDNPGQMNNLATLRLLIAQRFKLLAQITATYEQRGLAAVQREIATQQGIVVMSSIRAMSNRMEAVELQLLKDREATAEHTRRLTLIALLVTLLLPAISLSALYKVIRREIRPRTGVQEQAKAELEQRVQDRTEALQMERNKLAAVFDNVTIGLLVSDAQGGDITMNAVAMKLLGFNSAEDMQRRVEEYGGDWELRDADGHIVPYTEWPLVRAIRGDYVVNQEFHFQHLKSDYHWIGGLTSAPIRNAAGEVMLIYLMLLDITERKRIELAVRERMKELACLYVVSHDIQQDLSKEELCQRCVEHLIPAMQFPAITVALIELNGERYTAGNYTEGLSCGLHAEIRVAGETAGQLRVYYTQDQPFMLPFEQNLINGVVEAIGTWLEREQAKESLAQQHRLQMQILDSMGEGIQRIDLQGNIIFENSAALAMLGWSAQELIGRHAHSLMHHTRADGSPYPANECRIYATLHDGIARHVEDEVFWRKDGTSFPVAYTCTSVMDGAGKPASAVVSFLDITERKQAEQEMLQLNENLEKRVVARTNELEYALSSLRLNEERYRLLVNGVKDASNIMLDVNGRVRIWNQGAERLKGYTSDEIIGQHFSIFYPPEMVAAGKPDAILAEALKHGHVEDEGWRVRKDGSQFWANVVITTLYNENGEIQGYSKITRDITEKKRIAEELREKEHALVESQRIAHIGSWVWDMAGPLSWSDELYRVYGVSPDTFVPSVESFLNLVHPDDLNLMQAWMNACIAGKESGKLEFRLIPPDGKVRCISSNGEVIVDANNRPIQVMGTAQNITERKQVEHNLLVAKEKAELANRAKDSFLATMSHEIRTPLSGMLGMLEVLSLTQLDHDQSETLKTAWDSSRSLLRIVNDILDWSKIEEGKLALSPHATSIPQVLQEVINTYSRVASSKSLILSQQADARLSTAHIVDALRLSQVLNNFVSNAIKFTQRGEIELRAELLEQLESGERIRFSVKDTGIGIAKEVQQRLFNLYQQENADTARQYGGTGLGLAICRRLADMMDGQIGLDSALGQGSTFSITLTLPISAAPGVVNPALISYVEQRKVSALFHDGVQSPLVLAVDDHPINRDLLMRQIKLLGLRAETAENGRVALALWRSGRFALVITDCHMPEMDGYALTQAIRKIEAEEKLSRTPIIAWTANALAEEEMRCQAAGMDELLVKPTDLTQLKNILARWLKPDDEQQTVPATAPIAGKGDGERANTSSPIDYSVLDAVMAGKGEQAQLLRDFIKHIHSDRSKLDELLQQGDCAVVQSAAHRMRGSCLMVGAMKLSEACAAIEQATRQGDMATAQATVPALDAALQEVERWVS